jgi:hypothetical protein
MVSGLTCIAGKNKKVDHMINLLISYIVFIFWIFFLNTHLNNHTSLQQYVKSGTPASWISSPEPWYGRTSNRHP